MKKKTFRNARIVSLFLGFIHLFGYIWFADDYLSKLSLSSFFTISTGLALLITPLISDAILKSIVIRIIGSLLGLIGVLNNMYTIFIDLTLPNFPDVPAIIMRIVVLFILVIMVRRIINPQLED